MKKTRKRNNFVKFSFILLHHFVFICYKFNHLIFSRHLHHWRKEREREIWKILKLSTAAQGSQFLKVRWKFLENSHSHKKIEWSFRLKAHQKSSRRLKWFTKYFSLYAHRTHLSWAHTQVFNLLRVSRKMHHFYDVQWKK